MKEEIVAFLILMDQVAITALSGKKELKEWKRRHISLVYKAMNRRFQEKEYIPAENTIRDYRYMCLGRKPFKLPSIERCDLLCQFSGLVKWHDHHAKTSATLQHSPEKLKLYIDKAQSIQLADKKQKRTQDFYETYQGFYNVMFIEEGSTLANPLFGLSNWHIDPKGFYHYFLILEHHALIKSQWQLSRSTNYDFLLTENNDEWGFSARIGARPTKQVEDFGFNYDGIRELKKSIFSGNAYAIKAFISTEKLLPIRMKPRSFFTLENVKQCEDVNALSSRFAKRQRPALDLYHEVFEAGKPVAQYYLDKIHKVINILISKGVPVEH